MEQIAPQAKKIGQKNAPASFSMVFFRFLGCPVKLPYWQGPPVLHGHWRSYPMAFHHRVLLSLAASRPVVASSPFRIFDNCSRKNRLKHGFARLRRCAIGPCVPEYAIGRREPPVLHGHWRSYPMAPHRMAFAIKCLRM